MKYKTIIVGNGKSDEKINNFPEDIFYSPNFYDNHLIRDIFGLPDSEWKYIEVIDTENNKKYIIKVEKI